MLRHIDNVFGLGVTNQVLMNAELNYNVGKDAGAKAITRHNEDCFEMEKNIFSINLSIKTYFGVAS